MYGDFSNSSHLSYIMGYVNLRISRAKELEKHDVMYVKEIFVVNVDRAVSKRDFCLSFSFNFQSSSKTTLFVGAM